MATKNTKSPGNLIQGQTREYWINAAKQFKWPIKFEDLQILVPHTDLEEAENDLMVKHFRNAGWFIQSAIVEYTKPYEKPEFATVFKPVKIAQEEKEQLFRLNQKLKIVSTECELTIAEIAAKSILLKYTNRNKPDINTTTENLAKQIRMGLWIKL